VGGLAIGLIETFAGTWYQLRAFKDVFTFTVMIAVLLFRRSLMGGRTS
jgi:branched-subunit amino acid ABC-type transport system permease component